MNVPIAVGNPAKGSFLMLGKPNSHAMQVMQKNVVFFFLLTSSTELKFS